jgi:HEAT repeat protein
LGARGETPPSVTGADQKTREASLAGSLRDVGEYAYDTDMEDDMTSGRPKQGDMSDEHKGLDDEDLDQDELDEEDSDEEEEDDEDDEDEDEDDDDEDIFVDAPTNDEEMQVLAELSRSPSSMQRENACIAIGDLCDISIYDSPLRRETLLARLDDPHAPARASAFYGLAESGDRRIIPALARTLEKVASETEIFYAPEETNPSQNGKSVRTHRSFRFHMEADKFVDAAWKIPDPSYIPSLERIGRHHSNHFALTVLARCRALAASGGDIDAPWRGSDPPNGGERLQLSDRALFATPELFVQAVLRADATSLLEGIAATPNIGSHTIKAEDIVSECGRRTEAAIFAVAQPWSYDAAPSRRAAAALALSPSRDGQPPASPEVIATLARLTQDPEIIVATTALMAIASRTGCEYDDETFSVLSRCEESPHEAVRLAFIYLLSGANRKNEETVVIDPVVRLSRDPSPAVRERACIELGDTAIEMEGADRVEILNALVERFDDPYGPARYRAIAAAAGAGEPRAFDAVVRELETSIAQIQRGEDDEIEDTCEWLLTMLETCVDKRLIPILKKWRKAAKASDMDDNVVYFLVDKITGLIEECKSA